ncbi:MAG: RNA polymerase sigma factor, partial [Thermomicrobiales bacterium]
FQEVLLQVWERIESFDPKKGKFLSWISTVARRRAIDRIRQTCAYHRATDRFEAESQHLMATSWDIPEDTASAVDVRELIDRELGLLPVLQREAVSMAFLQGRSQREIAAFTHTPLGTVKTRIELGMKKLCHAMAGLRNQLLH